MLCLNFVKFAPREIGEIVRCLPDKKISPDTSNYGTDSDVRVKNLSREDAALKIQAGIQGMLARRNIRSEMQEGGAAEAEEKPQEHKDAAAEDEYHADHSDVDDKMWWRMCLHGACVVKSQRQMFNTYSVSSQRLNRFMLL